MHPGKLDMLTDGICDNLTVLCHRIHLHLLGMLDELAHHHGMFLADIRCQLQEAFQFLPVGADVHRSTGQYIGRTDQYREAHLIYKSVDVLQGGQRPPFGLVYTNAVEHGGELVTVFGIVDAPGACAENRYLLRIEAQGKVIRYLTTGRDNHPVGILQFENIHHALEGELVEVKTVAHVIVRRHGFGVVVYHDTAVAFLADGVQGLHAAPVELYGRTDAVGAGAQYDNGLAVAEVTDIICRAAIRQVEIVGLCGIFGGKGIYLLHYGQNACTLAEIADGKDGFFAVHCLFQAEGTGYLEIREALYFGFTQ